MSDQERAVLEAASALFARFTKDGEWYTNGYGQPTCIVCGSTQGTHDDDCELANLMNTVGDMQNNPAFYTMPKAVK